MSVTIESKYVHITDGHLHRTQYSDGSLALQVEYECDGYPEVETLSVNLVAYGVTPPPEHIYVKDYSGSEGLPDALVAAGVAEIVERVKFGPFDTAFALVKLVSA